MVFDDFSTNFKQYKKNTQNKKVSTIYLRFALISYFKTQLSSILLVESFTKK